MRAIDIAGEPWFVATDICRALTIHINSYGDVNTYGAVSKLAKHQVRKEPTHPMRGMDRRTKSITLVSEGGLYALIQRQ